MGREDDRQDGDCCFVAQFPRWNQRDVAYQSVYLSRCGRKSQARTLINEMVVGGTEERPLSF